MSRVARRHCRPQTVLTITALALAVCGCEQRKNSAADGASTQPAGEVVVYTALDRQFSEPILAEFSRRTGITVRPVFDSESTKTVGLANRIRAEKDRPRCDVFWNNEIVNTIRLQNEGLLQPIAPKAAADYPAQFRDPRSMWFGFAARARVLIVNTQLVPDNQRPRSIRDLADPHWAGRVGIAKPLFGTTATHVACLFAALGEQQADELLAAWKANQIVVTGGNKGAAEAVGAGRLAFALTDTDDALAELDAGRPVAIVLPDQAPGGGDDAPLGTLLLPNTLAVVHGAPNAGNAVRLIEYLLSPEVESRLASGSSGQIPLNVKVTVRSRAMPDVAPQTMRVDFTRAADAFAVAARHVEERFLAP
jgi:iron(III) transport system substrate-binding protein